MTPPLDLAICDRELLYTSSGLVMSKRNFRSVYRDSNPVTDSSVRHGPNQARALVAFITRRIYNGAVSHDQSDQDMVGLQEPHERAANTLTNDGSQIGKGIVEVTAVRAWHLLDRRCS